MNIQMLAFAMATPLSGSQTASIMIAIFLVVGGTFIIMLPLFWFHFVTCSRPLHTTRRARLRGGDLEFAMRLCQEEDRISEWYFLDDPTAKMDENQKSFSRREVKEMLRVGNRLFIDELRANGYENDLEAHQGGTEWFLEDNECSVGENEKSFSRKDLQEMARECNRVWERKVLRKWRERKMERMDEKYKTN